MYSQDDVFPSVSGQLSSFFKKSKPVMSSPTGEALQRQATSFLTSGSISREIFVESAKGATLTLRGGACMIDLCSQTQNCILGHNDFWVKAQQLRYQLSDAPQFNTVRLGTDLYYQYPQRLHQLLKAEGFSDPIINHRQCNGSDAVELAVHAAFEYAKTHTQSIKMASFKGSYHGQNLVAGLSSEYQPTFFLVDRAQAPVEMFDVPSYGTDDKTLSINTQAILDTLKRRGAEFFAVLIEPIQVRNNLHVIPIEFLCELRRICTEKNICLIFDECQTGFGWLGSLSVTKSHGVMPDIAVYSKAVTAGYGALAITVMTPKYQKLSPTLCSKTNSGYMPTLATADAVLDRLCGISEEEIPEGVNDKLRQELKTGLMSRVPQASAMLVSFLTDIKTKFPTITKKIKGEGLVRGLEIVDENGEPCEALTRWLINQAFDDGVYLRQAGHCIIIKPPLVITEEEYTIAKEKLIRTFNAGLAALREQATNPDSLKIRDYHR